MLLTVYPRALWCFHGYGMDNQYYIIHGTLDYPNASAPSAHISRLLYSTVNMTANNGKGMVVDKNIPIIEDYLADGEITAVRHANGQDWWIVIGKFDSNEYYRLLVMLSHGIR